MSGMGGSELAQFQVGPAHITDSELFRARRLVCRRVRGDQDQQELLAMLGLPSLPPDHGTLARYAEGCICCVCLPHFERRMEDAR